MTTFARIGQLVGVFFLTFSGSKLVKHYTESSVLIGKEFALFWVLVGASIFCITACAILEIKLRRSQRKGTQ
jgi:hypothetical protein